MTLASQLTEWVTIEQPGESDDGYGGKTISWSELATVYAQVKPILSTSPERLVAAQANTMAGYWVTIRLRSDVAVGMRIVWKSHALTIHSLHENSTTLSILTYEENV